MMIYKVIALKMARKVFHKVAVWRKERKGAPSQFASRVMDQFRQRKSIDHTNITQIE